MYWAGKLNPRHGYATWWRRLREKQRSKVPLARLYLIGQQVQQLQVCMVIQWHNLCYIKFTSITKGMRFIGTYIKAHGLIHLDCIEMTEICHAFHLSCIFLLTGSTQLIWYLLVIWKDIFTVTIVGDIKPSRYILSEMKLRLLILDNIFSVHLGIWK